MDQNETETTENKNNNRRKQNEKRQTNAADNDKYNKTISKTKQKQSPTRQNKANQSNRRQQQTKQNKPNAPRPDPELRLALYHPHNTIWRGRRQGVSL